MKKNVKKKPPNVEVTELRAETSAEEVKEVIKQTQMGNFPGHSGITYDFWKSWKEPKKNNDDKHIISSPKCLPSYRKTLNRR